MRDARHDPEDWERLIDYADFLRDEARDEGRIIGRFPSHPKFKPCPQCGKGATCQCDPNTKDQARDEGALS